MPAVQTCPRPASVTEPRRAPRRRRSILDVLSSPARRDLIRLLGDGPLCNLELAACSGMRQQAVSHHFTILLLWECVRRRREGKCNFYTLTARGQRAYEVIVAVDGEDQERGGDS